jgi:hypothetical protein
MASDREVLRRLASRWMEIAAQPVMPERARLWGALKDLRGERPMVLFETWSLENYVDGSELECTDPQWRGIEWHMRHVIRHAEEVGDDMVVEPVWRMGWHVQGTGYGVEIHSEHATDSQGGCVGYRYKHPIATPGDVARLVPQSWSIDRDASERSAARADDLFGDILPVSLCGATSIHAGLTGDCFRLIGNDNLLTWVYDAPEAVEQVMAYLADDRIRYHAFLEREGLLALNNNTTHVGSGSPGYTSALPAADYAGRARRKDMWIWMESQETTAISPRMFASRFLPHMARAAEPFGLVYYGCCEPVHDRWEAIRAAMPQVRAVSVSPWCDMPLLAGKIGREVVFSRKPTPAPISGPSPDWEVLEADARATLAAASGCNLEFVFRDVYRIGDRQRLAQWVAMVRRLSGE